MHEVSEAESFRSKNEIKPVGVLALQGDFSAHLNAIKSFGSPLQVREIRTPEALQDISALIIPGGESSTLLRLLNQEFRLEIIAAVTSGLPLLATCAGAILVAKRVLNPEQESLGLIDVTIERNSYGRQMESFITPELELHPDFSEYLSGFPEGKDSAKNSTREGIFIRAPRVLSYGSEVNPVLTYNNDPVLLQKKNILLATFHPELCEKKHFVYELFFSRIKKHHIQMAN